MLVSPMSGFSSSYNAVALMNCGDRDSTALTTPVMTEMSGDDGDGCWSVDLDGDGTDEADNNGTTDGGQNEAKGAPLMAALQGSTTLDIGATDTQQTTF